jgi:hypothetical protein
MQFSVMVSPSKKATEESAKTKAKKKGCYTYLHKEESRKIF